MQRKQFPRRLNHRKLACRGIQESQNLSPNQPRILCYVIENANLIIVDTRGGYEADWDILHSRITIFIFVFH